MSNLFRRTAPQVDIELFRHPETGQLFQVSQLPGERVAQLIPVPEVEVSSRGLWAIDPLALVGIGTVLLLLGGCLGYWAGYAGGVAGASKTTPVIVQPPATPVCSTSRSGNLLWSHEETRCR